MRRDKIKQIVTEELQNLQLTSVFIPTIDSGEIKVQFDPGTQRFMFYYDDHKKVTMFEVNKREIPQLIRFLTARN